MKLTPTQHKFVLHWGEMGQRWGINRTVAQIHALLFVSPQPLNAEDIAQTLSVARSNVSTSLRELQGWGIVKIVHHLGDRRDYFQTLGDLWEMYHIVIEERKRREIDPTIAVLRECVAESAGSKDERFTHERLSQLLDMMETISNWYEQVKKLPRAVVLGMAKAGAGLGKLVRRRKP